MGPGPFFEDRQDIQDFSLRSTSSISKTKKIVTYRINISGGARDCFDAVINGDHSAA